MKKLNEQFIHLLELTNLSDNKKASSTLGISTRTVKRYKQGITRPSIIAIKFLTILAGDLSHIDKEFKNWKIIKGQLISPNNETFDRARLEHIRTEFSFFRSNKVTINELKAENEKLKKILPKAEVIMLKNQK